MVSQEEVVSSVCQLSAKSVASWASVPLGFLKSSPLKLLKLPHKPHTLLEKLNGNVICTAPMLSYETERPKLVSSTTAAGLLLMLTVPLLRLSGSFLQTPLT